MIQVPMLHHLHGNYKVCMNMDWNFPVIKIVMVCLDRTRYMGYYLRKLVDQTSVFLFAIRVFTIVCMCLSKGR